MEKRQRGSSQEIDLESQKRRARRRREQQRKARRKARLLRAFLLLVLFLVLIGCIWGVAAGIRFGIVRKAEDRKEKEQQIAQEEELHAQKEKRIEEAREMATVYDYQGDVYKRQRLYRSGQLALQHPDRTDTLDKIEMDSAFFLCNLP